MNADILPLESRQAPKGKEADVEWVSITPQEAFECYSGEEKAALLFERLFISESEKRVVVNENEQLRKLIVKNNPKVNLEEIAVRAKVAELNFLKAERYKGTNLIPTPEIKNRRMEILKKEAASLTLTLKSLGEALEEEKEADEAYSNSTGFWAGVAKFFA